MGADESFDSFYAAQFHQLTLQLYAYTADVSLAQDAVQEAFTRAWARWDTILGYENPAAWIRRVAMNVAASRWRRVRAARAHAHYHRETIHGPSPDRVALARALATLPDRTAAGDRAVPHRRPVGGRDRRPGERGRGDGEGLVAPWPGRARRPAHGRQGGPLCMTTTSTTGSRPSCAGGPLVVPAGPGAARAVHRQRRRVHAATGGAVAALLRVDNVPVRADRGSTTDDGGCFT